MNLVSLFVHFLFTQHLLSSLKTMILIYYMKTTKIAVVQLVVCFNSSLLWLWHTESL